MAKRFRKAVDLDNKSSRVSTSTNLGASGIGGTLAKESFPEYISTDTERVISNVDSYIVLGRDRPTSRLSGYGGRGETRCSSIDMVVGRLSSYGFKATNNTGDPLMADPNFDYDAARIYISQKADIDDYFNLRKGKVGSFKARSGIGIKADALRLIGREGIKLITRTEANNSQGGSIENVQGIDLIAGNDDKDLQPMVKGNNLVEAIGRLAEHVEKLNGIVDMILTTQSTFNAALTSHTHPVVGVAGPFPVVGYTTPSPAVVIAGSSTLVNHVIHGKVGAISHRFNMKFFENNYLKPWGKKYINSRHNNTN